MKKYVAEKMIKKSLYKKYYSTLNNTFKKQILDKINNLIKEENRYCDKGNYEHLCNIFSAIAIYETLQKNGRDESQAFETTSLELYKSIESKTKFFQKFSKLRCFWPIMKIVVPIGFRYGSGTGWRFSWFDSSDNEFYFETNECIYQKIFKDRNLVKLGPMFCKCDVYNYGELNYIDFIRKGTLCYGDDRCDFRFVRYRNNDFVRTDSK